MSIRFLVKISINISITVSKDLRKAENISKIMLVRIYICQRWLIKYRKGLNNVMLKLFECKNICNYIFGEKFQ